VWRVKVGSGRVVIVGSTVVAIGGRIEIGEIGHRYSGHGTPGVQTGFTHRSFTAAAMTEISMRAEGLLAKFSVIIWGETMTEKGDEFDLHL
jgi:hypothetical protein